MEALACILSLAFLLGVATISRCDDLDAGATISLPLSISDAPTKATIEVTEDFAKTTVPQTKSEVSSSKESLISNSNPTSSYSTQRNELGVNKIMFNPEHGSAVLNFTAPVTYNFIDEGAAENPEEIRSNNTQGTAEALKLIAENFFSRSAYGHPWLILNRIVRETGREYPDVASVEKAVSFLTGSGNQGESDSTNLEFFTENGNKDASGSTNLQFLTKSGNVGEFDSMNLQFMTLSGNADESDSTNLQFMTESGNVDESQSTNVQFLTESGNTDESDSTNSQLNSAGLIHSMSRVSHGAEDEGPAESSNSKSNGELEKQPASVQPDSSAENSPREGREAGDYHEDLEGVEDGYPYWYQGRHFKEKPWPIQRGRPSYHSYPRYPVFPGK